MLLFLIGGENRDRIDLYFERERTEQKLEIREWSWGLRERRDGSGFVRICLAKVGDSFRSMFEEFPHVATKMNLLLNPTSTQTQ